jgi:hypothetical protein
VLFLFNCSLYNSGYVLAKFIAAIGLGCLVCTFEVVLAGGATAVLFVDFVAWTSPSKYVFASLKSFLMASGLFSHFVISFLSKWFEAYICSR